MRTRYQVEWFRSHGGGAPLGDNGAVETETKQGFLGCNGRTRARRFLNKRVVLLLEFPLPPTSSLPPSRSTRVVPNSRCTDPSAASKGSWQTVSTEQIGKHLPFYCKGDHEHILLKNFHGTASKRLLQLEWHWDFVVLGLGIKSITFMHLPM